MYKLMIVSARDPRELPLFADDSRCGISQTQTVADGSKAVSRGIAYRPDICLIDARVQERTAPDIIADMRRAGVDCCFLVLGRAGEEKIIREALRRGACDFFILPGEPVWLELRLELLIERRLREKQAADPVLLRPLREFVPPVRRILETVSEEYARPLSLKNLAGRLQMNPTYLGQLFFRETGEKFSDYLKAYRLMAARERILRSDEKISAIAAEVGYSSPNYFYVQFQERFHVSPTKLRSHFPERGRQND